VAVVSGVIVRCYSCGGGDGGRAWSLIWRWWPCVVPNLVEVVVAVRRTCCRRGGVVAAGIVVGAVVVVDDVV